VSVSCGSKASQERHGNLSGPATRKLCERAPADVVFWSSILSAQNIYQKRVEGAAGFKVQREALRLKSVIA
jgi:hypothetical protein